MANPTSNFNWQMPTNTDLVKDLPADFEVFGQAVDTSLADLKGGTSGQILAKNSNTDMDFVWIANDQGDITAVNVTSPITGGGSSGAVTVGIDDGTTAQKGAVQLEDSTSSTSTTKAATPNSVKSAYDLANAAIPKSLVDAAGDLIYATADNTPARLAIGTANQVLRVNSGATAPEWATPAGGGGMTSLAAANLPAASTTTLSAISTDYIDLVLYVRDFYFAADDYLCIRVNGDTGNSYGWTGVWQSAENTAAVSCDGIRDRLFAAGDDGKEDADRNTFSAITFADYANTSHKKTIDIRTIVRDQTNAYDTQFQTNGNFNGSAAITSITLFTQNGSNFSGGSYVLYGVK